MNKTLNRNGTPLTALQANLAHTKGLPVLLSISAADLRHDLEELRDELDVLSGSLLLEPTDGPLLLLGRLDLLVLGDELEDLEKARLAQLLQRRLRTLRTFELGLLDLLPLLSALGLSRNAEALGLAKVADGLLQHRALGLLLGLPADDLVHELELLRGALLPLDGSLMLEAAPQLLASLEALRLDRKLTGAARGQLADLLDGGLPNLKALELALLDLDPLLLALGLAHTRSLISSSL